MNGLKATMPVF